MGGLGPFREQSCYPCILLIALLGACRAEERPRTGTEAVTSKAATPVAADSLVATGEDGLEVWFTLTRVGQASNGTSCLERGLEIRRGGTRTQVPLLYTGVAPLLLNDSTMRAELWNHCRAVATYVVDLRSGRPVREPSGSTW
jgi:hypothetical protein